MLSIESSIVIERPTSDVYAYVSDLTNEPSWHTDILDIRATDPSEVGLGSRWTVTVRFMGRRAYEVQLTGFERDHRVEITTTAGWPRPTATYLLEPVGDGTRFVRRVDIPLRGLLRPLQPAMRRTVQGRNDGFVANLKATLERQVAPSG